MTTDLCVLLNHLNLLGRVVQDAGECGEFVRVISYRFRRFLTERFPFIGVCLRPVNISGVVHPASRDAVGIYSFGYRADRLTIGRIGRVLRDRRQGKRLTAGVGVVQFDLSVYQVGVCPVSIDLGS